MGSSVADKKAANSTAKKAAISDRGESPGLLEPLLVRETSPHRTALTDLAIELSGRAAGFRSSLPAGVLSALANLVRAMNCYYSNLIEGHDTQRPCGPADVVCDATGDAGYRRYLVGGARSRPR